MYNIDSVKSYHVSCLISTPSVSSFSIPLHIYVEKESGRQFERPVYRSLVDNILREGDLLVVTELKRFGRNYGEIYKEWFHITKEIGADIKVTSMPILDTTQSKELVGQLGCGAGGIRICGG